MGEDLQQQSFAMLPRVRREVATIDLDSSIHEVYGEKKEGADFAYNNTWSYSVLYGTLAETGDLLYMDLREGYRHTSYGSQDVLPGMIKRVGEHFRAVRMRADSGYYDQKLVQICAARGVEFFIVAKKHANVMKAVKSWFKGKPEIASMVFRPDSWSEPYRPGTAPAPAASGRDVRRRRSATARSPASIASRAMVPLAQSIARPAARTRQAAPSGIPWAGRL